MSLYDHHTISNLKNRVICADLSRWDEAVNWCEDNLGKENLCERISNKRGTWYYVGVVFRFEDENAAFEFKIRFG